MSQPKLDELLDFSDVKAKALPPAKVEVLDASHDPANKPPETDFSWGWVWVSMGSFVLAQILMHGLLFKASSLHGLVMFEVLIDFFTYFGGAFIVGVVSPKVRVMEPAVAAVLVMVMTLHVGFWLPTRSYLSSSLFRTLVMAGVAFFAGYHGAMQGERLTRQIK